MAIRTVTALVLYCPRCGSIEKHIISRFALQSSCCHELLCGCGQVQATISVVSNRNYKLNVPCVVCHTNHTFFVDSKSFWYTDLEKIYCNQVMLELGFFGNHDKVTEMIAGYKRESASLLREKELGDVEELSENPQVMLEVLNKIHDIAEKGSIYCSCGSKTIIASLLPNAIKIECLFCGGYHILFARNKQDLSNSAAMNSIELLPVCISQHKN